MENAKSSKDTPASSRLTAARIKTMLNQEFQFIFVKEYGTKSPKYKATGKTLSKVRSRARTYAARNFKQRYKMGQKAESTEVKLLAPQKIETHGYSFLPPHNSFQPSDLDPSASPHPILDDDNDNYLESRGTNSLAISQRAHAKQNRMITTKQRRSGSLPSPRELLGAGRVDPFMSYPTETLDYGVHELLDVEMNYVLPGMWPDEYPRYGACAINSTSRAWFSAGIKNPFLFNVLLWSACCHRDVLRGSKMQHESPQALSYKLNGIRHLNEVLSDSRKAITDEVIFTIVGLAAHEVLPISPQNPKPFNSPLTNAGALAFYSIAKEAPEHLEAIKTLIALREGLDNLKLPGLAETFHIGDISKFLNFAQKPLFPLLRCHETYIATLKKWIGSQSSLVRTSAKAFRRVEKFGISDVMFESFECIGCLPMAIEHYLEGRPGGLTLGQIVRTRLAVQKRLLMLPTASELRNSTEAIPSGDPDLYECCRLTAIIFSVAVIFPTPNQFGALQTLARELKTEMEGHEVQTYELDCLELLLWILVLGGIAALGKVERPWFVSNLEVIGMERLKLHIWDSVEQILKQFLWLDSACSAGGHQLWEEVKIWREEKLNSRLLFSPMQLI